MLNSYELDLFSVATPAPGQVLANVVVSKAAYLMAGRREYIPVGLTAASLPPTPAIKYAALLTTSTCPGAGGAMCSMPIRACRCQHHFLAQRLQLFAVRPARPLSRPDVRPLHRCVQQSHA